MGILRLAHVDLTVTDLDLATAYYTEVIGMIESGRDEDSVYLKCWDEVDHHSLRLRYAPRVGFDLMSFRVEREDDLSDIENIVSRYGFPVERISKGESVGQGESIRFDTPSGHIMELVYDVEKTGRLTSLLNPAPFVEGLKGIAPPRMDHLLVKCEEVGEATKFYTEVLGFRVTEQLLDGDGHQAATWMERSHSPHDLALVTGQNGGFHHFAYWLDDWPTSWRTTASRSTSARPGTGSPAATPSTSSTRSAPETRCSPAAIARTRTSRPSPGPRTTSVGPSSTTRATSTPAS